MKTSIKTSAKSVLTAMFIMVTMVAFSQKNNTWVGGTPGMEDNWNCAKNWSTYSVPDEFTNVIIPDVSTTTFSNPIIKEGEVQVNAIFMESDAMLTVGQDARMIVFGFAEGVNEDNVKMEGNIFIINEVTETATAIASVDELR